MKTFYHPKSYQLLYTEIVALVVDWPILALNIAITIAALIFITGCTNTPAPTEQMAISKAAVSNASSAGGNEFAPLQIKSATEKMDSAERAMAKKEYVLAQQLSEQAQVDAQLAEAMIRTAMAQKAADALKEDNRVLRQEIDRKAE